MQRILIIAFIGAALGQSCTDTTHRDSECKGDAYKTVKHNQNPDSCCALCAVDSGCVQWSYNPGFFIFASSCTLSKTQTTPTSADSSTCGQKSGPAPSPPAPPSPPTPPGPGAEHHWAVIMAGSNTYGNYRHQADACHAYQIAKKKGIPESHIILLAYDDIATNRENPFPGKMFNKPNGPDVYAGCKIDYKGKDVTKANFIKVLTGDTSASGPVLKSKSTDRVFVYFADHGGVGILGVPNGAAGGYIHAKEVNTALETMHSNGMYKELLFYVEACESGSIFKGLLKAPNVFAVTAANAKESSWGFYCPPQDKVNGKSIGSCLGDEFSIRWMEDADVANFNKETVLEQVQKVTTEVKKSHVSQFGDSSIIGKEVIGAFEGTQASVGHMAINKSVAVSGDYSNSAVDSRDVEVQLAYIKLQEAATLEEKLVRQEALAALLAKRMIIDDKFMSIATAAMAGDKAKARAAIYGDLESLEDVGCHAQSLEIVVGYCGPMNEYTMRYSRLFANLCKSLKVAQIEFAVQNVCKEKSADVVV